MTKFEITNTKSGLVLGQYEAATEADALEKMAQDAGYATYAKAQAAAPADDGEIVVTEVRDFASEIAAYIAGSIRPEIDPNELAAQLVAEADLADDADDVTVEVPGRYTKTGNPLSVTV